MIDSGRPHSKSRVMRAVTNLAGKPLLYAVQTTKDSAEVLQKLIEEQFASGVDLPEGLVERFSSATFFRLKALFVRVAQHYYNLGYEDAVQNRPRGLEGTEDVNLNEPET